MAHGFGLKLYVHRGHLIIEDGTGRQRNTRRYHRATSKLTRLVLIGHTGYITLDALRWLHDTKAALIHIDADARLLTTSTPRGPGHAAIRRSQAVATTNGFGVEIARELLHAKVAGQRSLLAELPECDTANDLMSAALDRIEVAEDLQSLVGAEADAAAAYWSAWSPVAIPVGIRDRDNLPGHWHTFGKRHSLLANGPRLACNPANAILNYLYALLEAEATLACHTVGLDPMLGIFHTDQRHRDSLALDVMEPVRPVVDAYVLALLTQRTLSRDDFIETRQGSCRITHQLAERLAETTGTWRRYIAPVVEQVAQMLNQASRRPVTIAAPLTHAQHHAAWSARPSISNDARSRQAAPNLPNACRDCGSHLPDRRRRYCDTCRSLRWTEHADLGRENAGVVLARLRTEQRDPAHGGKAAEERGRKNAAHQRAICDWNGEQSDPAVFAMEIHPGLRSLPTQTLVAATGLSEHYCSLIRLGKRVPHQRHWNALKAAAMP